MIARSPRTAERPMAFSAGELLRGAALTYACFLPLTLPAVLAWAAAIAGGGGDPAAPASVVQVWLAQLLLAGVWALGALVPATAVAALIGLGLRRVRRDGVHLLVHAANGIAFGVLTPLVWLAVEDRYDALLRLDVLVLAYGAVTGAAAAIGWLVTSRLALRATAPAG